jgi:glutamyl/glutaminyl-tRNA synthetase
MSKELIQQLAKEHGEVVSERFDIAMDWPNDFAFTLDELEAFAKAYQAAQPVNVLIEALQKMAKYPSTPKDELSATGMRKIASDAIAAYEAAAPIDNVAEALEKIDKLPKYFIETSPRSTETAVYLDDVRDLLRALIPDTQAKKGE